MPDADERPPVGLGSQLGKRVRNCRICEIDPTDDPATKSVAAAVTMNSRVSGTLGTVCTSTVASTPAAVSSGRKSSGPNVRRMGSSSAPAIQ